MDPSNPFWLWIYLANNPPLLIVAMGLTLLVVAHKN